MNPQVSHALKVLQTELNNNEQTSGKQRKCFTGIVEYGRSNGTDKNF